MFALPSASPSALQLCARTTRASSAADIYTYLLSILSPLPSVAMIEEVEQRIYKPTAQYQADEKEAWSFIKKDAYKPVAVG